MPTLTLGQLSERLARSSPSNQSTFFMEPGGVFTEYVNEMGPRIYAMGMWRDLLVERVYSGADGYISLERDIEAVLHANVNNRPQKVNAMFHVNRFLGCTDFIPESFGLTDAGFHASKRDFITIQDVDTIDDMTPVESLWITDGNTNGGRFFAGDDLGTITLVGLDADNIRRTWTIGDDGTYAKMVGDGIVWVESVVATDVPSPLQLRTDPDDDTTIVCEINPGTDVPRYRRFLVGGAKDDTYVHIVAKRAWTDLTLPTDIVWLGNISAWKHALLCKVAEDTADVDRAEYHWSKVRSILDDELAQFQGAARPVPTLDFNTGSLPIHNLY